MLRVGPRSGVGCTFVLFDILLAADAGEKPDILVGEKFPTLFEHVGVPDMKRIKDAISINSDWNIDSFAHLQIL